VHDTDRSIFWRRVKVDSKTPKEISTSKEENVEFKDFENPSYKICSKVNW
jgi:hypothetical protein